MEIKDTKEFLVGNFELLEFMITRLKDGADFADAMALFTKLISDTQFKTKLEAAYTGVKNIGPEIKDLDLNEGIEVIKVIVEYVPRLIKAAS